MRLTHLNWREKVQNNAKIKPPFFELGPKAYMYGRDFAELAIFADSLTLKYDVTIIVTPQYVDISMIAEKTKNVFIFAQHIDPIPIGRGVGLVLPEAIKAAGASGVLLNHVERRLSKQDLIKSVQRAKEVGLMTMVCADDLKGAVEAAKLEPTIIIAESPGQIGGGKRDKSDIESIQFINRAVAAISKDTLVLHGAGINGPQDVYDVISAGAQGTGSTSGVILAKDPCFMLEEMIKSVHQAWLQKKK